MREANGFWSSFSSGLLDIVYPPKCALCGAIGTPPICETCKSAMPRCAGPVSRPIPGVAEVWAVFDYKNRAAQAVTRLKYERATSIAGLMAEAIAQAAAEFDLADIDLSVPVPIHWTRRFARGFNQSELLCEALQNTNTRALKRIRATRPQVGLTREERLKNLNGAFKAAPCVAGKNVLLVDDVLTTGHTAEECAKALKSAGAKEVKALFFAAGGA